MFILQWRLSENQNAAYIALYTLSSFKYIAKVLLLYKSYCEI